MLGMQNLCPFLAGSLSKSRYDITVTANVIYVLHRTFSLLWHRELLAIWVEPDLALSLTINVLVRHLRLLRCLCFCTILHRFLRSGSLAATLLA